MRADFRSIESLEVFKDNEHVANLIRLPKGCEFRYTKAFLDSDQPPIALHLPKNEDGLRVEGLANLPTYFAGLLPEGVMFNAVRRVIGSAADDLFAVLAATGADAIGDIDVRIPGEAERKNTLNLAEASKQIAALLGNGGGFSREHLAAIPGVQPKMSLGALVRASRTATYFAKFQSPEFPGLIENEFVFMRLAKLSGLDVSNLRLEPGALVITRFDRVFDKRTKQMQKVHVEDMLQVMDLFPNSKYSMEYIDLMRAMQAVGVSKPALLHALRLYVYSYIIGNGDLHAKNVSLAMDKTDCQWRLTPAYDLLSTLPYQDRLTGADRMALALEDEAFGRFTLKDFTDFGLKFGLPEKAVRVMIGRVAALVSKNLAVATEGNVSDEVAETIRNRAASLD